MTESEEIEADDCPKCQRPPYDERVFNHATRTMGYVLRCRGLCNIESVPRSNLYDAIADWNGVVRRIKNHSDRRLKL